MSAAPTLARALYSRRDLPSAVVASWVAMGELGTIRRHKRSGRLYLDLPGKLRLWTARVGGARMPFTDEAAAHRVLEAIRWHMAQGKTLAEAVAFFQGEDAGPNQIHAKLGHWIEAKRREVRAGDLSPTYLRELDRYAAPGGHFAFWDGLSIFQADYAHLEDWSAWLADRGLGPKSRWNVLAAFHSFLTWLYRREDLPAMPRQYPWPKVPEHAPMVLTAQAQGRVLAAIPDDSRGIFLALGLMGLRPGEAVALSAGDYRDGWLTVSRARKGARLDAPVRGTKTGRAKRLPVPDELAAWLAAHPPRELGAALFRNPRTEGRWAPSSLRREWVRACKAVGVTISVYEGTKHTFATDAALRGVSERALQAYLGHADVASTRKYARLADSALVDVLPRLPGRIRGGGGSGNG